MHNPKEAAQDCWGRASRVNHVLILARATGFNQAIGSSLGTRPSQQKRRWFSVKSETNGLRIAQGQWRRLKPALGYDVTKRSNGKQK